MIDPYIQKNGTLNNKLNIADYSELNHIECELGFLRLIALNEVKFEKINPNLLKKIHKYIFQDIYEWAGEYRTVPIYKEEIVIPGLSLEYANYKDIPNKLDSIISKMNNDTWNPNDLDDFSQKLTDYSAKLWRIHPFRDGNTRLTLAFAAIFAKEHGIDLNLCEKNYNEEQSCSEKSNSTEHNSSSKNANTLLSNLIRVVDKDTGKIKQYSIRDKFVLAALDKKDYPEPQYLNSIFRQSISKIEPKEITNNISKKESMDHDL